MKLIKHYKIRAYDNHATFVNRKTQRVTLISVYSKNSKICVYYRIK